MNPYKINFIYCDKTDLHDIIIKALKAEWKRKKCYSVQKPPRETSKNRNDCP